jgi:hypothetical protein
MTDVDANYIARTYGTDALRRTIDSNMSTRATSGREQYADTIDEFSGGVLTDLAPLRRNFPASTSMSSSPLLLAQLRLPPRQCRRNLL